MQSSLKKSLYLGLAALSFASVASVTANSSNANAAKKHRAAKKVTYKTTDRNLDQSVVFQSTGKSAVYSKPGTVKGANVVATKADMASKANSKSTGDQFMAYQSAVTSKGVHYYKVVSFDKKVRGYVYAGGVNKVAGKTSTATPSNTTGYLNSNRLFNVAYGSQFGAKLKNFNGINFSTDKFTVNDAVSVRNGAKYYNVTDNNNAMINGWVNADYFTNDTPQAVKDSQSNAKAVKVTFYDAQGRGVVLSSKNIQPNSGFYNLGNTNYTSDQVNSAIKSALVNSGYSYNDNSFYNVTKGNNNPSAVQQGDSLNVNVNKENANINAKFTPYALDSQSNGSVSSRQLSSSDFAGISNEQLNEFASYANSTVPFDKYISDFFDNGKVWNVIKDGNSTYTFDKAATMKSYNDKLNNFKKNNSNKDYTFADAASDGLTVLYNKDTTDNSASVSNVANNDNTNKLFNVVTPAKTNTNANQDLVNKTVKDFNSANSFGTNADQFMAKKSTKDVNALLNAKNDSTVTMNSSDANTLTSLLSVAGNDANGNVVANDVKLANALNGVASSLDKGATSDFFNNVKSALSADSALKTLKINDIKKLVNDGAVGTLNSTQVGNLQSMLAHHANGNDEVQSATWQNWVK
ncbi:hypothetical protein [Apilactobacillus timberlakei]|uniref:hypothetical protein n=1 Tax=Apilactobacillus timberlakei TaxID=2008380 RepID=UPI001126EC97|nr:hypothetical protein [Apilactobacillus timberlakei]TPR19070.1 hypothetical protein DYZ95_00185 [Apilactobacillus timberlakei]